jgi:hypothetical protein
MKAKIEFHGDGCDSFTMTGKSNGALIETGVCNYNTKVLNAQDAGAQFVILASPKGVKGFPGS